MNEAYIFELKHLYSNEFRSIQWKAKSRALFETKFTYKFTLRTCDLFGRDSKNPWASGVHRMYIHEVKILIHIKEDNFFCFMRQAKNKCF